MSTRRVVPLNTGKVQIGLTYSPRPTVQQATAIERFTRNKRSMFASPAFWIGGLASVGVWTLLYFAVTA